MKYKQEFESELNLMLADPKIMGKYSEQQITETLFEYWSMKDFDLPDLHEKEVYSDTNNFINESKQLSKSEQKTLVNLLYKKYKYLSKWRKMLFIFHTIQMQEMMKKFYKWGLNKDMKDTEFIGL